MADGPITECLKAAGRELHTQAEHGPFARELFKGRRPVEHYGALLGQMWHIHAALERAMMDARRSACPPIESILHADTPKSPLLAEDLHSLGLHTDDIEPLDETRRFMRDIAHAADARLIGIHYVLEGSTNGNHYSARAIRRAYGFEGARSTRYLDPYADNQRERWQAYKAMLDGFALTPDQREAIIEGDLATFRALIAIHDELDASLSPACAPA